MRAAVVREFGGPDAVQVVEAPVPQPGPGEIRIKVAAAAVNPADVMVRIGALVQYGAAVPAEQHGLGVDIAGTVDAVGDGVHDWAVGDEVIGLQERQDLPTLGQAEYAVLEAWAVAKAPAGATAEQAATLPLNGTTAEQALDMLGLTAGQWLLVTGAAGGVGSFAIQLAVIRGLRVVAQAGHDDEAFVRGLGAELFVDRDAPLGPEVRRLVPGGVDGVLDAAQAGIAAADAVAHGGSYVSLLLQAPGARRGMRMHNLAYHTDGPLLARLSDLAGSGRLTLRVAQTFPLDGAAEAHKVLAQGGIRGRLVLVP